jgi:uncharacterized cupredoxin-like copper-binding protein
VVGALMIGSCADDDEGAGLATDTPRASTGTDSVRFDPDSLAVPAGQDITLTFSAESGLEHDFVVEDVDSASEGGRGDLQVAHADAGEATDATFRIDEPGAYTVYCSVPGHRQGGMVATLDVQETN